MIGAANRIVYSPNVFYVWKQRASHSASLTIAESSYVAIRELLKLEQQMIVDYGIDANNSCVGMDKLFSRVKSCLMQPTISGFEKAERVKVYRRIRDLLLPYADGNRTRPSGSADRIMFILLMTQRYSSLALFIGVGIHIRTVFSR